MNPSLRSGRAALLLPVLFGFGSLLTLVGCATSADVGYASGGPAYVDSDDYVYYPNYEVYYSSRRHDYLYRDGNRWVRHSTPPHGFLQSGVSVQMDFHDTPEHHHRDVVRRYPRTWKQSSTPSPHDDHDHGHDNDRHDRDHDDHDHDRR